VLTGEIFHKIHGKHYLYILKIHRLQNWYSGTQGKKRETLISQRLPAYQGRSRTQAPTPNPLLKTIWPL